MPGIQLSSEEEPLRAINGTEQEESKFMCRTISVNALVCNNVRSENFDIDKAKQNSREGLAALGVKDGLQAMLAKLQGIAGQKIIVERVDVHQGGQAVVGTVNASNRD